VLYFGALRMDLDLCNNVMLDVELDSIALLNCNIFAHAAVLQMGQNLVVVVLFPDLSATEPAMDSIYTTGCGRLVRCTPVYTWATDMYT
jgi:hypothetical protein